MFSILLKLIKFATVGLFGLVLDFTITWLFKEKIRINKYIASGLGFSVAVLNNYFLHRI